MTVRRRSIVDVIPSASMGVVHFRPLKCLYLWMTNIVEQRYLSLDDAAKYLGLSVKTLYKWAEKGEIPAYKVGRLWRFDRPELDDFVRGKRGAFI